MLRAEERTARAVRVSDTDATLIPLVARFAAIIIY